MKWWQYLLLVLLIFALLILIVSRIPGSQHVIRAALGVIRGTGQLILFAIMLLLVFALGGLMGILARLGIKILDDRVERETYLAGWQTTILVVILGLVFGAIQIWYMPIIMSIEGTWLRSIVMMDFGIWSPWMGAYENPPFGWGIYGLVVFLIGYFLIGSD